MAYTLVAGGDMLPTRAFHISGSPSEGFTIHHQGTYPAVLLMDDDEKGDSQTLMMQDGKRVNCSYEMEIRISAAHWDNGRPSECLVLSASCLVPRGGARRPAEPPSPTGTTGVPPVAGAAHGPSMERTRRPFSQYKKGLEAVSSPKDHLPTF